MGIRHYDEKHHIWYTSFTPDGKLWVETTSKEEFKQQNKLSKLPLKKYKHDSEIRRYNAKVTEIKEK